MTGRALKNIIPLVFLFIVLGIGALVLLPADIFHSPGSSPAAQTRLGTFQTAVKRTVGQQQWGVIEQTAYNDTRSTNFPLEGGEVVAAVLTGNFDDDPADEYILACRNLWELDQPISLVYLDTAPFSGEYKRMWTTPTAATRSGTISLYTLDIVGDSGTAIVLSGMNNDGEETLTILRKNPAAAMGGGRLETVSPFVKIAELRCDGFISILETARSPGQPCTIAVYSRDDESPNALDRVEIIYTYNPVNGLYEQSQYTNVPGAQIEQRRVRELLSGTAGTLEQHIEGLWYFVNAQGSPERGQYIYFDYSNKEIIFYDNESEQIFVWQTSTPTRYGLSLASQNRSVTTLKRFISLELESLDNLRIRVTEDVQLKIGISASWDGVYRKAESFSKREAEVYAPRPYIEAVYTGDIGKLTFNKDGTYELSDTEPGKKGKYTFFLMDQDLLLELRPEDAGINDMYHVRYPEAVWANSSLPYDTLSLTRIRLSTRGILSLHEPDIFLTLDTERPLYVSTSPGSPSRM
ncbi:MAG: pallilysin-related adhesin [Spirochaetaceae bacterium]|jgi:hypothetical protein|nr:pallilysin-related adhesin [Spirochaetaceae bacterium]